jgi:hypothetical protein
VSALTFRNQQAGLKRSSSLHPSGKQSLSEEDYEDLDYWLFNRVFPNSVSGYRISCRCNYSFGNGLESVT